MHSVSYTELRSNLKAELDDCTTFNEPTLITRQGGQNCVLMSLSMYQELIELKELLSSKDNVEKMVNSLEKLATVKGKK